MGQVTWRAPDDLIRRAQSLAAADGISMNEFLSRVLTLATNSDEDDAPAVRLRNRLKAAGLLAGGDGAVPSRPSAEALTRARRAAGRGTSVAQVVSEMRQ